MANKCPEGSRILGSAYKRGKSYCVDTRPDEWRIRKRAGPLKRLAKLVLEDIKVKVAKEKYDFNTADGNNSDLFKCFLEYSEIDHVNTTLIRYCRVIRNFEIFPALNHPDKKKVYHLNSVLFERYKRLRRETDLRTIELLKVFRLTSQVTTRRR